MIKVSEKDIERINLIAKQICDIFEAHGCPINKEKDVEIFMWGKPYPLINDNRTQIYLAPDAIWKYRYAQIAYQLAHEITHFHNSETPLPQKIKWVDELLCVNAAFFILQDLQSIYPTSNIVAAIGYFALCVQGCKTYNIDELGQYLQENIAEFEKNDNENMVYKEPHKLDYVLYFNRQHFNFWRLLKVFKETVTKIVENSDSDYRDFCNALDTSCVEEYTAEIALFKKILNGKPSPF